MKEVTGNGTACWSPSAGTDQVEIFLLLSLTADVDTI